jgi:double-stranded uracil-DNA glycosylase
VSADASQPPPIPTMSDLWVRAVSDETGLRREAFVAPDSLPMWLNRLHRALPVGATVTISMGDDALPVSREDLLEGAGFARGSGREARRERTLADTVGAGMRLLVVGLNPSPYAADAGIAFARPGNRFWPAAQAAGLVTVDRDPEHALSHHRLGLTDLVKRPTRRADELTEAEFRRGVARLQRLVAWLRPSAVCIVGLSGWRLAVDRTAGAGWQATTPLGAPSYVMPNTSALNARASVEQLSQHLAAAATPPTG